MRQVFIGHSTSRGPSTIVDLLILQRWCLFCLIAENAMSECNDAGVQLVYLWTAGALVKHEGSHMWRWPTIFQDGNFTTQLIRYRVWPHVQFGHSNGTCIALQPRHNYEWKSRPCSNQYCFVCENRNALRQTWVTSVSLDDDIALRSETCFSAALLVMEREKINYSASDLIDFVINTRHSVVNSAETNLSLP